MFDLGSDLLLLLRSGYNPDLTLVCAGGGKVEVHRLILVARSSVFRAMMEVDMKERDTGTVDIKDFELNVVSEFVKFLYSDKISDSFPDLPALLAIGHKYQVFGLVNECSKQLAFKISLDNIVELGTLGETYQAKELLSSCVQFLDENLERNLEDAKIDSLAPSLLRNLAKRRRYKNNEDTRPSFLAHLFDPTKSKQMHVDNGNYLLISFNVNIPVKLVGIGLYVADRGFSDKIPVKLEVAYDEPDHRLLKMSTEVSPPQYWSDLQKILFPEPVYLVERGMGLSYSISVKIGGNCVCGVPKEKTSVKMNDKLLEVQFEHFPNNLPIPVFIFKEY
jgi:hypothetical protein